MTTITATQARIITELTDGLTRPTYAVLEARYDGPIPPHLLVTDADREHRAAGARGVVARMKRDYTAEAERLACEIVATPDGPEQDRLRTCLDGVRRSLESLELQP